MYGIFHGISVTGDLTVCQMKWFPDFEFSQKIFDSLHTFPTLYICLPITEYIFNRDGVFILQ